MCCSTLHYQELYTTAWGKPLCKYSSGPTETCDAMILGSIMKGLRSLGLVPDFDKFILKSVSEMQIGINAIRIEFLGTGAAASGGASTYCGYCGSYHCASSNRNNTGANHKSTCSFLPDLRQKIATVVDGIKGLSLTDFKRTAEKSAEVNVAKWDLFDYK